MAHLIDTSTADDVWNFKKNYKIKDQVQISEHIKKIKAAQYKPKKINPNYNISNVLILIK